MTDSTSAIAYYDVEVITAAHVSSVGRAVLEGTVRHVHSADAVWLGGDVEHSTVAAARSPELWSHLSEQLDALSTFARARWIWRRATRWRGIDLVAVARSAWFTELTPLVHRAWVCEDLLAERPGRLVWVTDDSSVVASGFSAALRALASDGGTHADVVIADHRAAEAPPCGRARTARALLGAVRADLRRHPPARRSDDPTVLIVEAFPNHLPAPIAVARELEARSGTRLVFAVADNRLLDAIPDDLGAVRAEHLASRRARLARHVLVWAAARSAHRLARTVASGAGPTGAWGALLEPGFRKATVTAFRRAGEVTPIAADAVHRLRPAAVVSSTKAAPLARAAVFAANGLSTTTFFLQHGALVFSSEERWAGVHDRFLVWGERDRRRMVAVGLAPSDIIITGSLKFETLAQRARTAPVAPATDVCTVAFLPSRTGGRLVSMPNAAAMLNLVLDGCAVVDGVRLVVKVHPSDRSDIFDVLQGRQDVDVDRTGDPIEVMASASVVIAATSTAGLEACALGRPLVVLALPGVQLPEEYELYQSAVVVSDTEGLAAALEAVRDGEPALLSRLERGRKELVEDLFAGMTPGTAMRCADAILGSVGEPRTARPPDDAVGAP